MSKCTCDQNQWPILTISGTVHSSTRRRNSRGQNINWRSDAYKIDHLPFVRTINYNILAAIWRFGLQWSNRFCVHAGRCSSITALGETLLRELALAPLYQPSGRQQFTRSAEPNRQTCTSAAASRAASPRRIPACRTLLVFSPSPLSLDRYQHPPSDCPAK